MDQTFFLEQQFMPSHALYMVGTPIGNLADITYRAVHILKNVDGVACEDTRHTSHLLSAIGVHKPLMAIHEHNELEAASSLIRRNPHHQLVYPTSCCFNHISGYFMIRNTSWVVNQSWDLRITSRPLPHAVMELHYPYRDSFSWIRQGISFFILRSF